jgi:hypothetical protein
MAEDKFNHDREELYNLQDELLEYCIKPKEEQICFPLPKSLVKYLFKK